MCVPQSPKEIYVSAVGFVKLELSCAILGRRAVEFAPHAYAVVNVHRMRVR